MSIQPWPRLSQTPSGIQLKSSVKALRELLNDEAVQRGFRMAQRHAEARKALICPTCGTPRYWSELDELICDVCDHF